MLAEIGIVAAVYAVLTWVLAPASYGPLQLRVAEILKPLVIWEPHLIAAFVLGNFLSNLLSPFSGPWELAFMPFANLVGATLCYVVGRRSPWTGAAVYALVIALAVSIMLSVLLQIRFGVLFPWLVASEAILIIGGVPIMRALLRAVEPARRRLGTRASGT
ncbi:MAG: QueT transporter family protein [bacterium]